MAVARRLGRGESQEQLYGSPAGGAGFRGDAPTVESAEKSDVAAVVARVPGGAVGGVRVQPVLRVVSGAASAAVAGDAAGAQGGEKLFVGYAGQTVPVWDRESGAERAAQMFVAALGEFVLIRGGELGQGMESWLGSHVRALEYFGGSPVVRVWIAGREHPFGPAGPVLSGAGLARGDMAAAGERFHFQEQLGHAVADVFVFDALRLAGLGGLRILHLADQLLAGFVHADDRILGVVERT